MSVPAPATPGVAARAVDLRKIYGEGDAAVEALRGVIGRLRRRRVHRDHGAVGVGQVDAAALPGRASTRRPRATCSIGDVDLTTLSEKALTELRRDKVGFVFQAFNLVPTLTARGEHHAAARHRGHGTSTARGSTRSSTRSGSATGSGIARPSSPAASSSAWPVPGRW